MRKLLFPLALAALLIAVIPATLVLAIAQPDDPPQVDDVIVYQDLLEDGDLGVLINYYIDYTIAGTPTEYVTDSYLFIFIDTDGTTQLKAIAPYTFVDNGYYRGIAWIYFSAAEVTTYRLDSANQALYRVWCTGNPTVPSGWTGDPPKTVANISQWWTTGTSSVRLARQVLAYADMLELAWTPLKMIESTGLGNRLTSTGAAYFTNVIPNLRTMAPACFSTGTVYPTQEDIDYSVSFGAVASGAIVDGSPVTLAPGANTLTVNAVGTFALDLEGGTYGTIQNGTATIASSPSDLVPGTNTITVTGGTPGTLTATVALASTQQGLSDTVTGTGFDLTNIANRFGMSRLVFSSLLWFIVTLGVCAGTYFATRSSMDISTGRATNITMLVFVLSLIGGTLLGLLDTRVSAMLAIGYGGFIGYVLFFRTSADIGRTVMFMGWMWFVVCLVGGLMAGTVPQATTVLTADITDADTTITVRSTEGFREQGIVVIGDERIAYHHTTDTEFKGTFWRHLVRGAQDTEAVEHTRGAAVRSMETAMLNDTLNYNIALLSDASGIMAFVTIPLVLWDIMLSFIFLPISFLGTDMVILTYVWGIFGLGLIVSLFVSLLGGRRV